MRIAIAAVMSLVALAGVSWSQDAAVPAPTSKPAATTPSTTSTQPTDRKRGALGVSLDAEAVIKAVMPGSGAAKASLQVGDAIIRIDDQPIKQTPDLAEIVRTKFAGDKVRVTFVRDGKEQAVEVTLGQSQQFALPPGFEAMAKASYKPVKGALRAVAFLDDKVGYAAGDEGLCQATADGGETWKKIDTGSKATYRAILIIDKNTVYLCGDSDPDALAVKAGHVVMLGRPMTNSTVTYTRDGGKTWTAVEAATNFILTSLAQLDDARLLVGTFGGDLHRDGDVGVFDTSKSWSDGTKAFKGGALKTNRVFRALSAMCRINDKDYAAVGSPVSVGFMPTPDHALYKARAARAIFSSDGGATWKPAGGSDGPDMLRALAWRKGLPMVAVGDNGAILSSQDNGVTWTKADSPVKAALAGVAWSAGDAPIALAVGKEGVVAVSLDRGKTWRAATVDDSLTFTAVAAVVDGFAAATVQGKVIRLSPADLQHYLKAPAASQPATHAAAPSTAPELTMPERFQKYGALSRELAKAAADKDYAKLIDLCQQQAAVVGEPAFDGGRANYNLACVLAQVGRKDDALKALNLAVDQGFSDVDRIKNNSSLKSLQGDERFAVAVNRAELGLHGEALNQAQPTTRKSLSAPAVQKDAIGLQVGVANANEPVAQTREESALSLKPRRDVPQEKPFYLYVPKSYAASKPGPVVVILHPRGPLGSFNSRMKWTQRDLSQYAAASLEPWKESAEKDNILLVLPVGDPDTLWMGVSWYTGDRQKVFEALLAEVASTHAYDARRVYVVGSGEGAHVAVATALRRGDLIAAVAACNPPLFDDKSIELMRTIHFTDKTVFSQTIPETIFPQTVPEMLKEAGKVKPPMLILAGKADMKLRPLMHFWGDLPVQRYEDDSAIPLEHIKKMVALLKDGGVNVELKDIAGGHYNPLPQEEAPAVWEFLKKHSLQAATAPTSEQTVQP